MTAKSIRSGARGHSEDSVSMPGPRMPGYVADGRKAESPAAATISPSRLPGSKAG
jgi:hypothetical protein